jgi:type IV pilus assembly protein PilB
MARRRGATTEPAPQAESRPRGQSAPDPEVASQVGARLGDLLIRNKLVNSRQIAEALLQQSASGKRLGELLVELGALSEVALAKTLSEQLGIPDIDLRRSTPEPAALERVPESIARSAEAMPLRITEDGIEIAVADPMDTDAMARLQKAIPDLRVLVLIAPKSDIRRAIERSYRALVGVERFVDQFTATETARRPEGSTLQMAVTEDAPVVQIVNLLITQGLRDRASDIHIEPQDGRVRIRYRIDGALHDVLALPETMSQALVSRIKIMANMNIVERQRPQDGQITTDVEGRDIDIRVSTTPTVFGEKTVLRLLDRNRSLYRLDDLGMPNDTHDTYSKTIRSPFGMVLCAGPTGSGKTTTLYASLNEINQTEANVMTVEDPVEYVFPSINQIPIREQTGVTFASGLRAILRQDPDIILVGEIRDEETARIAIQAALTGHFVLTSLHATDSATALHRFLDMGIEPFLIASSVAGIVAQRLVRRICPSCKVRYAPSAEELVFYVEAGGEAKSKFWHGEGCNFCAGTGFHDRIGVYELMRVTETIKQLVVRGASHDEIRETAIEQGMRTLRQEALSLVSQDVTTIAEVLRSIYVL